MKQEPSQFEQSVCIDDTRNHNDLNNLLVWMIQEFLYHVQTEKVVQTLMVSSIIHTERHRAQPAVVLSKAELAISPSSLACKLSLTIIKSR